MATVFFSDVEIVEITLSGVGAYEDVDLSSYVSANASGAIILIDNVSGDMERYAIRCNGSTDDRYYELAGGRNTTQIVKLDASMICEIKAEDITAALKFYLVGYTESECVLFENAYNISLVATGSYVDMDLSSYTTASPIVFIVSVVNVNSPSVYSYLWDLRCKGSTDDFYVAGTGVVGNGYPSVLVKPDDNQIIQGKIASTNVDFWLVGYFTEGVIGYTNLTEINPANADVWEDYTIAGSDKIEIFADVLADGVYKSATFTNRIGIALRLSGHANIVGARPNGSSADWKSQCPGGGYWILGGSGRLSEKAGLYVMIDGEWVLILEELDEITSLSGVLTVGHGGTGLASWTQYGILYAPTASTLGQIAVANSSILITNGSGVPSLSTTLPQHTVTTQITVPKIEGGTGASATMTLSTTSHGTKGKLYFGTASVYDQANDRLGLNNTAPDYKLDMTYTTASVMRLTGGVAGGANIDFRNTTNSGWTQLLLKNDTAGVFALQYIGSNFATAGLRDHAELGRTTAGNVNIFFDVDAGSYFNIKGAGRVTKAQFDIANGTLDVSAFIISHGRKLAVTVQTADYVVANTIDVVIANKTTAMTVTLPDASASGRRITIKNINTGVVTVDGEGSDTIDGVTTQALYQWESITVVDYVDEGWVII
jgi:hypothetical protein